VVRGSLLVNFLTRHLGQPGKSADQRLVAGGDPPIREEPYGQDYFQRPHLGGSDAHFAAESEIRGRASCCLPTSIPVSRAGLEANGDTPSPSEGRNEI
jgi:hypothetical protein